MKVAVGIPTFGRPGLVLQTINEVLRYKHPEVVRIYVVDQTPRDSIDPPILAAIEKVRLNPLVHYEFSSSANLPGARNRVLSLSQEEIIIWIDDDVLLHPNFIEAHVNCYRSDRSGRKTIAVAGNPFHRVAPADEIQNININNFRSLCRPHFPETASPVDGWPNSMVGANHSVRRENAIAVGGYDEHILGGYCEDGDFTFRLGNAFPNDNIVFEPAAWLIHLKASMGGCRIEKTNKWSEFATLAGPMLCYVRHRRGVTLGTTVRMGPLRRENVINPLRQPAAWYGWITALVSGLANKDRVKSPFFKHNRRRAN